MPRLSKSFYGGVFVLSIGMLAAQFLLTRILSVIFWYHFVFMIISIVMFGLTVGTLLVYFFPKVFTPSKTVEHIVQCSVASAIAILASFLSLFYLPKIIAAVWHVKTDAVVTTYFPILLIPFVFMGIAFALILTRFPTEIGRIYGVNLMGSAAGCLAAYVLMNTFSGPSVIFVIAAMFIVAAHLFTFGLPNFKKWGKLLLAALMAGLLGTAMINQTSDFIKIRWTKGQNLPGDPYYSKWNFFSHVAVVDASFHPFGWGYSHKVWDHPMVLKMKELMIIIDHGAGTVLTKFENIKDLHYLNMDSSSMAYRIRRPSSVLVIGAGGGRDLFTAVYNGAAKVTGVEINRDIMDVTYSVGMIQQFPQVTVHNDDGRSFVARSGEHYDIIQASLVDSFAAASNGAFALSENSLYTKEAWVTYLKHLTPTGILTFSRWYHVPPPLEVYRILTLAKAALSELGVVDARRHIILIKVAGEGAWPGVGTILVSLTPFTDQEISVIEKAAHDLDFEVALSKDKSIDPVFDQIFKQAGDKYDFPSILGNIDAPTDNKPFYFYFSDLRRFFTKIANTDAEGPRVLKEVTVLITGLAVCFIAFTLFLTLRSSGLDKIYFAPTLYYSMIGLAFMFIEIPLIQRLGIFLGHPIYGLTVVLFGLLSACGFGSMYSKKIKTLAHFRKMNSCLLGAIILIAFLLPAATEWATAAPVPVKVLIAIISVVVAGFFMGMPFPFGVTRVSANPRAPLIFYWAVNGFMSMCATAFATVVLIHFGFQWAVITGLVLYCIAFSCAGRLSGSKK